MIITVTLLVLREGVMEEREGGERWWGDGMEEGEGGGRRWRVGDIM